MEPAPRLRDKFFRAGGASRGNRRDDPAAGLGDLLVGSASAAHGMLVRARTREDEMGVAIDEAGRDPRTAKCRHFTSAETRKLRAAADPDDPAAIDADGRIANDPKRVAGPRVHRRDMTIGEQAIPHDGGVRRWPC